ncbi:sensor histidine kinase [Actinomycetospora atypica]|uniref:histidine kinase n=1 Tax=Actinomycetospora atypica TaxID=1290095 RepID=A0ABV9YN73_9PSEU
MNLAVTLGFGGTALVLAGEPHQGSNVRAFVVAAACWTAGYTSALAPSGPWAVIQWVLGPLVFPALMAVLLRYPRSQPLGLPNRVLVVGLAGLLVVLRATSALVSEPAWHGFNPRAWWPTVTRSPTVAVICDVGVTVVGTGAALLFAVIAARRLYRTEGIDRRLLHPVATAALAAAVVVGAEVTSGTATLSPTAADIVFGVEALALLTIPAAFGVSAVRRRLAHAAMSQLVVALARPVTPDHVRRVLAESLSDPTLRVIYHHPDGEGHVDPGGMTVDLAPVYADRCTRTVATPDGTPLATLDMHPSLAGHPNLVDAAFSAARLALENSWLQATTKASLTEVRESRARIVGAGDEARRRLERDLHDGVQQRLLALKVALAIARPRATSPDDRAMIDMVRAELQETLDELRGLARGLHPAILTEAGLGPAVHSVVERLPLEVDIRVDKERLDPIVDATAYFVCCEALANIVKHSGARRAAVDVERHGTVLHVSIRDDGSGGAEEKAGGGLAGLRDRVMAVGGSMRILSDGGGTRVQVTIPCA